jgi:hypothetical protein
MKLTKMKHYTNTVLSSLVLLGLSLATTVRPAQAGFLDGITDAIRGVNNTVNGVRDTHKDAGNAFNNLGDLGSSLGLGPAKDKDIFDTYSRWYGSVNSTEKEVIKALVSDYAEEKQLSFGGFKKSPQYAALSPQAKSQASAVFFKFKSITVETDRQKDKFLAFAFCLSGGGKNCR